MGKKERKNIKCYGISHLQIFKGIIHWKYFVYFKNTGNKEIYIHYYVHINKYNKYMIM